MPKIPGIHHQDWMSLGGRNGGLVTSSRIFGTDPTTGKGSPEADDRDSAQVVAIFRKAHREFGAKFTQAVQRDMNELRYDVHAVESGEPRRFAGSGEHRGAHRLAGAPCDLAGEPR